MKKHDLRLTLLVLNLALLFANCVKEFNYVPPNTGRDQLVVSGLFTNDSVRQIVRLSLANDYEYQTFRNVRNAVVKLKDDAGHEWRYNTYEYFSDVVDQYYYYLDGVQGVPGHAYSLDIVLETGEHYTTEPQVMPEPIVFNAVKVVGEKVERIVSSTGTIVYDRFAAVYAQGNAPLQPKDRFGRFDMHGVYIFEESPPLDPFDPQRQCFVKSDFNTQNISLIDFTDRQPGADFELRIGQKPIDGTFRRKFCFNVNLLAISRQAHQYWTQISKLIQPTGTIIDPPPGLAIGNVWRDGDPLKPAIGFFEVASVDTHRAFVVNGALGYDFATTDNICSFGDQRSICRDCLKLGANASLTVPWYWE